MSHLLDKNEVKRRLGAYAATLIKDGMVVGIGTGTTADCFIQALGVRCQEENLRIVGVATSHATEAKARKVGIPIQSLKDQPSIDLCVDGADQADANKCLIKGLGGALMREKIIAASSHVFVVIIDESKKVEQLGECVLPLEVVPFAIPYVLRLLQEKGYRAKIRGEAEPFVTDNGNNILDVQLPKKIDDPEKLHIELKAIPGIVETGLFCNMASLLVVGQVNGDLITIR